MEIFKIIIGLLVFVAILYGAYYASKMVAKNQMRCMSSKYIKIIDRLNIGKDAGLTIVQVGQKYMLASISAGKVEVIRELDEEELVELTPESFSSLQTNPFIKNMIDQIAEIIQNFWKKAKKSSSMLQKNKRTGSASFQDVLKTRLSGKKRVATNSVNNDSFSKNNHASTVDELLADSISKTKRLKSKINLIDEGANNNEIK